MEELFRLLADRLKNNNPSILITITKTRGGTPGKNGFKILVGEEGRIAGTIGGGAVEFHAINKCKELFISNTTSFNETIRLVDNEKQPVKKDEVNPSADEQQPTTELVLPAWCGGEVELFYEIFNHKNILYIFGAGHVGAALAELAVKQGFYVEFFDNRKDILDALPENIYSQKHFFEYPPAPFEYKLNTNGFALIVTQSHKHDLPMLDYLLTAYPEMRYIGMIGSKLKVTECIRIVKEKHAANLELENLYAPVGLNIGGDTPAELSISIMAEIFAVINKKPANHMRLNYSEIGS
jgi:xanthine dehydrogenase accessory factor